PGPRARGAQPPRSDHERGRPDPARRLRPGGAVRDHRGGGELDPRARRRRRRRGAQRDFSKWTKSMRKVAPRTSGRRRSSRVGVISTPKVSASVNASWRRPLQRLAILPTTLPRTRTSKVQGRKKGPWISAPTPPPGPSRV